MKKLTVLIILLFASIASAQESFVQVPPDSTGKKLRHYQQSISSNTVYLPGFFLSSTAGTELGLVASPIFVQFSDGAASYVGAKTGQLPAALDGSGFLKVHEQGTATIAGTVTANIGTTNGLALDATLTGGTQKAIARGGAKGATTAADVTSTANGADHNGLDVQIQNASIAVTGTVTTTPPSNASTNITQLGGTTIDTNSGTKSAGTQRVVIATDQPTNTNALKVDGSAVTQPISGSVTANIGTSGSLALDASVTGLEVAQASTTSGQKGVLVQGAVTTSAPTYTTAQTSPLSLTTAGAMRTDGSGVTQPVSGTVTTTPPANASTNIAQVAGTTADTNSGAKSAGTLRVVLATDQPQLTNKLLVTPDSVALPANQSVNDNQIGGTAILTGNGATGAGSQRMTVASDNTPFAVKTDQTTHGTTDLVAADVTKIAGSSVSAAAAGVQKVGIVGNAGATVDSTVAAGTAPTNAVVTGAVYNTTAPAPTTGQAMAAQADQAGNLRIVPGVASATLSAWNSATALNATQTIYSNSGVGAVLVHLVQTTTLTAGAITYEISFDGTNWITIPADAVLDPTSTSQATIAVPYTVQASTNKAFLLGGKGWQALRIKLSTQITGTGTVTPNYTLLAYEPVKPTIAYSPTAANFSANIGQFGGTNVVTGTGAAGSGIPRVTISNDSSLAANQSMNAAQIGGTNTVTGGVAGTLGIGGPNATNAAITGNPLLQGIEAQSGQPTAATTGNIRQAVGSLDGAQYVRDGGPVTWSCGLTAIAATLTQCQAAPGAGKLYITDIQIVSTTATGGQFLLRYGTGSNCATGTTTLYPNISAQTTGIMSYPGNTVAPYSAQFKVPYAGAAANAICIICVATNTCTVAMSGFTAP
jgi:hypothetical protein